MQTLVRKALGKLREKPALAPFRSEIGRWMFELDRRLPERSRPRQTRKLCYRRLADGAQCNRPIYMWPDGRFFCYDHPEER